MKKIAAILLIAILFFNLGGYRLIFPLLQQQADRKLESLLDNEEYDESQLIEFRVALNMPYQQRFTEYERHYGQIDIEGVSYTYVKKKIEGDIVIFKCIPNESKQQLRSIQHDLAKAGSTADMDHSGQSKKAPSSFAKNVLSDYDDHNQSYQSVRLIAFNKNIPLHNSLPLPQVAANTPHQPPEC
ncbi:MAG: hypothetical protein JNK14_16770 [Chitinophagaceae bacterium]|nr:hypothetical protein [Chitinophagaceae bacterium]